MKEDNKFDELIKEKTEKKRFKYRPFFWFLFAKKAGIAALSIAQMTCVILVGVTLLSGGTFALVKSIAKNNNKPHSSHQKIIDTTATPILTLDTLLSPTQDSTLADTISLPKETSSPHKQQTSINDNLTNTKPQPHIEDTTTSRRLPKKETTDSIKVIKKGVRKYNIRILEIDPDTIPSNY